MSNMVVRTNVLALNSHRNLGMVGRQQSNASARLSSGFRINSAADDAAGLGISEKMRSQIRGLDQASRNAQDGVSLIQTAEGAMSTINDMVVRIRELVVQAANDTNAHEDENRAQSDRVRIQDEINQLMDEIDATRNRTQFNTRNLIDGSLSGANAAGFDQHGFNREMASYLNSSEYKTGVTQAGNAAVAASTVAQQAQNSLTIAQVSLASASIAYEMERKTNAAMNAQLEAEKANRQDALDRLNSYVEQLNGKSPSKTEVVNAITAMIAGVTAALVAVISQLQSAGVNVNQMALTSSNIGMMSVSFMGTDGTVTTMALSGVGTYLNTNTGSLNGSHFQGVVKALQDAFARVHSGGNTANAGSGIGVGGLQTAKDANGNVVISQGNWNGINFGTALGTAQISYAAFETFQNAVESLFSPQAKASLDVLIDRLKADNDVILAAISGAQSQISSSNAQISVIESQISAAQSALQSATDAYNSALISANEAQAAFDTIANPLRSEAETKASKELELAHSEAVNDKFTIEEKGDDALWFQVGANVDQGVKLNIDDVGTRALSAIGLQGDQVDKIGNYTFDRLRTVRSENIIFGRGEEPFFDPDGGVTNVHGQDIQNFITAIDQALAHVTGQRSKLGAMQNRLDYTMQNLDIASENLSASESRIRDADMAKEMMRLTQSNVLQQAATAMLAQANQAPQSVLQLLG